MSGIKYAYEIYQLPLEHEQRFMSYKMIAEQGKSLDTAAYNRVYKGELIYNNSAETPAEVLEELYTIFNLYHPEDYRAASLSMSDVVVLMYNGKTEAYCCDTFGWVPVTNFIKN